MAIRGAVRVGGTFRIREQRRADGRSALRDRHRSARDRCHRSSWRQTAWHAANDSRSDRPPLCPGMRTECLPQQHAGGRHPDSCGHGCGPTNLGKPVQAAHSAQLRGNPRGNLLGDRHQHQPARRRICGRPARSRAALDLLDHLDRSALCTARRPLSRALRPPTAPRPQGLGRRARRPPRVHRGTRGPRGKSAAWTHHRGSPTAGVARGLRRRDRTGRRAHPSDSGDHDAGRRPAGLRRCRRCDPRPAAVPRAQHRR